MKPRDFSYGGMFVRKTPYAIACACMLLLAGASAWLIAQDADPHARITGFYSLAGFLVLFAAIGITPLLIRRALIVRIDSWGVYMPTRLRTDKRNGLAWDQIAEVRLLHAKSRDAVALIPHSNAYLSPLMQRFGAFILPPVNVPAEDLKRTIDEYRAGVEQA